MKHVAPVRWADLAAGRLSEAEADRLRAHADVCERCGAARDRVAAARTALRRVGQGSSPSLSWDLLGARLYWSVSSERRRRERQSEGRRGVLKRLVPFLAVSAVAASGVVAVFVAAGKRPSAPQAVVASPVVAPSSVSAPVAPPPPPPLASAVTFVQGEVSVAGRPAETAPAATLKAGDLIKTDQGKVGLQLGDRSGILVEPQSAVELVAFDEDSVVLRVSGAVTVELEKRRPGQGFAVLAGDRRIEVRGTVFRVASQAGDLDVAVTRGKVAVMEAGRELEVDAPMRLALAASAHIGSLVPQGELAAISRELADGMHVPMMPVWTVTANPGSAMMSVTAPAKTRVTVDGQVVATGSFALRTLPGRHLVAAGRDSRWVDVQPGASTQARFDDKVETARNVSERPSQVDAELRAHRAAVDVCAEMVRKASPGSNTAFSVEVGVNTDGSVDFVSPVRSSDEPAADSCVMNLIRDHFHFEAGTKATVQKVIHY